MSKNKNVSSAVDFRNVSENFGAEILNNFNSKNMLQQSLTQNFVPVKAGKRFEGILLNKICLSCVSSLCIDVLFFMADTWKTFYFLDG